MSTLERKSLEKRQSGVWGGLAPVDSPRIPSHYECPKCKFYVRRFWWREPDGWGHFIYKCLRCGVELT